MNIHVRSEIMNILYCGDSNIYDGLIISLLSIIKHTKRELNVYILTMKYDKYKAMNSKQVKVLDGIVKEVNKKSFVKLIDATNIIKDKLPTANIDTRFTPYCMLRLYADLIEELPDKLLYLDNDIVAFKDISPLYDTKIDKYELTGVLDHWGQHFYQNWIIKRNYLNSGVLLLNMKLIKKNHLFEKCRELCTTKKMLLPDQHALNYLAKSKKTLPRIYNEQAKLTDKTVIRHFTTTFKFFPTFHTQTVKPWNIEDLHNILNIHELDDILDKYKTIRND